MKQLLFSSLLAITCANAPLTATASYEDLSEVVAINEAPKIDENRKHMIEPWGNLAEKAKEKGFDVSASFDGILVSSMTGGEKRGTAFSGSLGVNFSIDLERFAQIKRSSLYFNLVQRMGDSLSAKYIGNQFPVQQNYGGQNFRLDSLYFMHHFWDKKSFFQIGKINAGDHLLQSPLFYNYISNAFDGNPIGIFFNMPFSAYPNAQWGAFLQLETHENFEAKLGVYNTNKKASENKEHGVDFSFHSDNGALGAVEIAYKKKNGLNDLPGRYALGVVFVTGKDQVNQLTKEPKRGNQCLYIQLEQQFAQQSDLKRLDGYAAFELFPTDRNLMPFFLAAGLIQKGCFFPKKADKMSLGIAYGSYSSKLKEYQKLNNLEQQKQELDIEFNYSYPFAKWLRIQPGLIYIINPRGLSSISSALVAGVQFKVTI